MPTAPVLMLALAVLLLSWPRPAAAAELARFENPQFGLAFEFPASWKATSEPHGMLPDELFAVRAADGSTSFGVAVYQLPIVVTAETLDGVLEQQDRQVQHWLATQSGGRMVQAVDVVVDDAAGREYIVELAPDGHLLRGSLLVVVDGHLTFEISQWAAQEEYDARVRELDAVLASLVLPWSPPTS